MQNVVETPCHYAVVILPAMSSKRSDSTPCFKTDGHARSSESTPQAKLRVPTLVASKLAEWNWEDHLAPSVAFLDDDTVCLGGNAASLTTMDFLARRGLFRFRKDAEAQAQSDITPKPARTDDTEGVIHPGSRNTKRTQNETTEDTLMRRTQELCHAWRYHKLVLSTDGTLLGCARDNDCGGWSAHAVIDVWNVMNPASPRLVASIPSTESKRVWLRPSPLNDPYTFIPASNDLIVIQDSFHLNPRNLLVVSSRTGELLRYIHPFTKPGQEDADVPGTIAVHNLLVHPKGHKIAVCLSDSDRGRVWEVRNVFRKKEPCQLPWSAYGPALALPGTSQVAFRSEFPGLIKEPPRLEIWDWNGNRLTTIPANPAFAHAIAASPDGAFVIVAGTVEHTGRVGNRVALKNQRLDVSIERFWVARKKTTGCVSLGLAGVPLAFRLCANGQIRGVTSVRCAPFKHIECHLMFWLIESNL